MARLTHEEFVARVFDGLAWPAGLPRADAERIASRVREEITQYPSVCFPGYWRARLAWLAKEALLASAWRTVRAFTERN